MKIKVIDLLNKIANGEEVPQQIKIYDEIFVCCSGVRFKNKDGELLGEVYPIEVILDEKVEIIEEEPKGIPEKLEAILDYSKDGNYISKVPNNEQLMFKINEIIDYLKSKGEII